MHFDRKLMGSRFSIISCYPRACCSRTNDSADRFVGF